MTRDYTTKRFKRDGAAYTAHIEQKLRYLKVVLPLEMVDKSINPFQAQFGLFFSLNGKPGLTEGVG